MATLIDVIIPFLIILTVLVFVHEMGHYLVARRNAVRVEVFSIGFGPEIFGWNAKNGTRWKISAIPLGGYVKMFGDADPTSSTSEGLDEMTEEEKKDSFHFKTLGQRSAIVAAGPAANFLFAIVLLAILYVFAGQPYTPATIDEIVPGSAAEAAGFEVGDLVTEIDGTDIDRFEQMAQIVGGSAGRTLEMVVDRGGASVTLQVTPKVIVQKDRWGGEIRIGRLGVRNTQVKRIQRDPASAVWYATLETWNLTVETLKAVTQIFSGNRSTDELGGPVRIAQMSGDVVQLGIGTTLWFMAVLSVNLGLINLFPIPVLDGGHLVFYAYEAVFRRPMNERLRDYASMAGLTLVVGLMIFLTWNDIARLPIFQFLD